MDTMIDPPERVQDRFIAAGWSPGRTANVSPDVPKDHPAFDVLTAFDGLVVRPRQVDGEECACMSLDIRYLDSDEWFKGEWEVLLKTRLIGIAQVEHGHGHLCIADDGRCYFSSYVSDDFWFEGQTFAEAVERILVGRKGKPMLRPVRGLMPHVVIRVRFLTAAEAGRKTAVRVKDGAQDLKYGCSVFVNRQAFDCRFWPSAAGGYELGEEYAIPIRFLSPELAMKSVSPGTEITLWERNTIAVGQVLTVLASV